MRITVLADYTVLDDLVCEQQLEGARDKISVLKNMEHICARDYFESIDVYNANPLTLVLGYYCEVINRHVGFSVASVDKSFTGTVHNCYVSSMHRHTKIGTALMTTTLDWFRANRVITCNFSVKHDDDVSLKFARKMGFACTRTVMSQRIQFPSGIEDSVRAAQLRLDLHSVLQSSPTFQAVMRPQSVDQVLEYSIDASLVLLRAYDILIKHPEIIEFFIQHYSVESLCADLVAQSQRGEVDVDGVINSYLRQV